MPNVDTLRIRSAVRDDTAALMRLFAAVNLFEPDELSELAALLDTYFSGTMSTDHHWLAYDDGNGLAGAAYFALDGSQERMAPGTWNLYFIGVMPERQGTGCGSALIRHVEDMLAADGAVDLLVETSGMPSFEATRAFYERRGYRVIERVADAYRPGDDKVIYSKRVAP